MIREHSTKHWALLSMGPLVMTEFTHPACQCPCHQVERDGLRMKVSQKESTPEGGAMGEQEKLLKLGLSLKSSV